MSYFLSVFSGIASYFYINLGINTYKANRKSKECLVFLMLNICLSIWSFFYAFAYVTTDNYYLYSLWNKLSAIGWCTFTAFILYMVLTITKSKLVNRFYIKVLIFLPGITLLFTTVFFFGPGIETPKYIVSFFYLGDFLYNTIYFLLSMFIIYNWGRKSNKIFIKKQSRIILITSFISFSLNLLTQSILPLFGITTITTLGHLYALIMMHGVRYSIKKYHFLKIPNSLITRELFHEIRDLTFLIDMDGNIIRINKQAINLLQYRKEELIQKPITKVIKDSNFAEILNNTEQINKTLNLNDIIIQTKTGVEIPANITISPLIDIQNQELLGYLIVGQDIRLLKNLMNEMSNHKVTADKLRLSEELFRTMVEAMPFSIVLTRIKDNTVLYINNKTEELYRVKRNELIGKKVITFYKNPEDRQDIVDEIKRNNFVREKEVIFKRGDDSTFAGVINVIPTIYNEEDVLLSCIIDITEGKLLQQNIAKSEEMLRKLMNSIPDMVTVCDNDGNINYLNNSIKSILGYDTEDINRPSSVYEFMKEDEIEKAKNNVQRMFQEDIGPVEYTYRKKDGALIDTEVNGVALRDRVNNPFGLIFVTRDISERKRIQDKLQKSKEDIEKINNELLRTNTLLQEKSVRDSLTGFYNHQYSNELLEREIERANKSQSNLCLMMLDIDYFKRVNDNYGHQIGDMVLLNISNEIKSNVRECDFIGRYGGEEFIIILPNIKMKEAYEIAESLRKSIEKYKYEIPELKTTISIGVTELKGEDARGLINRADKLLYEAKNMGRNRVEY